MDHRSPVTGSRERVNPRGALHSPECRVPWTLSQRKGNDMRVTLYPGDVVKVPGVMGWIMVTIETVDGNTFTTDTGRTYKRSDILSRR
jgi:hypothetical protein